MWAKWHVPASSPRMRSGPARRGKGSARKLRRLSLWHRKRPCGACFAVQIVAAEAIYMIPLRNACTAMPRSPRFMRERAKSSAWSSRPASSGDGNDRSTKRFHAEKEMVMKTFLDRCRDHARRHRSGGRAGGFTVHSYDMKAGIRRQGLKGIAGAWDKISWPGARWPPKTAMRPLPASSARWTCRMPPRPTWSSRPPWRIRRQAFHFLEADGIVSGCILATNTSSLSVTAVASGRPDKVVGPHFQSRAHGPHRDQPRRRHFRRNTAEAPRRFPNGWAKRRSP